MSFVTKDSGQRETYATGMVRDSAQKDLRPDLVYGPMFVHWAGSNSVVSGSFEEIRDESFSFFIDWLFDADPALDTAVKVFDRITYIEKLFARAPMLVRWAELMGRGAAKYGERNWEKASTVEELERFKASGFRHFVQWYYGMNPEEDHAAAVFFNISGAEHVKAKLASAPTAPEKKALTERWADWPSDHVGPV